MKISDLVCRRSGLLVRSKLTHRATNLVPALNVREDPDIGRLPHAPRVSRVPRPRRDATGHRVKPRAGGRGAHPMHDASPIALRGVHARALKADLPTHHATGPPRAGPAYSAPQPDSAPTRCTVPLIHPPWRRCGAVPRAAEWRREVFSPLLP